MELLVGIGILVLILLAVVGAPLLLLAGLAVVLLNLILLPFKIAGCLLRAGVGVAGFSGPRLRRPVPLGDHSPDPDPARRTRNLPGAPALTGGGPPFGLSAQAGAAK